VRVEFQRSAEADLVGITEWIERDSPAAAQSVRDRILETIVGLSDFPRIGRQLGDREWYVLVVPMLPYVVTYRIDDGIVIIVSIVHTSRNRTP